jgi:ABC-type phosphate transport system permease subunit
MEVSAMKLDVKAMAITVGLLWGILAMFLTGVANLIWPAYGKAFLDVMASVYPGYTPGGGFGQVITGTLYGVVDGAIAGAVFAWLYNRFVGG